MVARYNYYALIEAIRGCNYMVDLVINMFGHYEKLIEQQLNAFGSIKGE